MNVLSKLSIKNLKLNKKRTISTIIGIILSVALICAVSTLFTSVQATLIQNAINEYGYYHLKIKDIGKEDIASLNNNRDIEELLEVGKIGDAIIPDSQKNEKEVTFYRIFSMNRENFDKLKLSLKEGNFPTNDKEIVVNENIISRANVDFKIGDTVSFDIGEIDFDTNEISSSEKKNYKIVGIIKRPSNAFENYDAPYTVITSKAETVESDVYISLKNPKEYKTSFTEILGARDYQEVKEQPEKLKYQSFEKNRELLRWEDFAFSDSTVSMLYAIVGVVLFVILFTSVFCIRNSFAISTTEKIKMYGMLASVGATKKQIRHNVIFECMVLGIIGIPLGIVSGIFAVFVLLQIVNALIGDQLLAFVDGLVFKISLLPVIVATVLGVITIYLSAISSARRASKVSPIDNLRGSKETKLTSKKLKTPKFISKFFKTGGVLAYKNLKRSKRKYRTTVTSISISIFIFITLNAFIVNAFDLSRDYYTIYDYNLTVQHLEETANEEEAFEKILKLDNIKSKFIIYYSRRTFDIVDKSKVNLQDGQMMTNGEYYDEEIQDYVSTGKKCISIDVVGLDDETFKAYAKKIKADYDKIKDKAILCDQYQYYDNEQNKNIEFRRYNYNEKDTMEGFYQNKEAKVEIGKVTDIKPYTYQNYYNPNGFLILNVKYFKDFDFKFRCIALESNDADVTEKEIKNIDSDIYVRNIEEEVRQQKAMTLVVSIFLYGFIAVITLIGITNIFNTITSNMELRQKEFAMLKSVGMTKKEFNNMINLETLFYGTKSWIYGTILGICGTFAIYKAFEVKVEKGIYIPVKPIFISALFVFVFVFIIMRYSISKINKQNTIETIRNENI